MFSKRQTVISAYNSNNIKKNIIYKLLDRY